MSYDPATLIQWDAERSEPYLQLPFFPDLRLIPIRNDIEDDLVELFNWPKVGTRLFRLPYPFPRSAAEEIVATNLPARIELLDSSIFNDLKDGKTRLKPPSKSPRVRNLLFRCIYDTTQGKVVGDVNLTPYYPATDPLFEESKDLWRLGYVLAPAYHGKGVMQEVIRCLIDGWIRPYMDANKVKATSEVNNIGSTRVLERNGFKVFEKTQSDWPEEKGGGKRDIQRYELYLR